MRITKVLLNNIQRTTKKIINSAIKKINSDEIEDFQKFKLLNVIISTLDGIIKLNEKLSKTKIVSKDKDKEEDKVDLQLNKLHNQIAKLNGNNS